MVSPVVRSVPGLGQKNTHSPIQALPVLPTPPVRQVQPVAPALLNPRNRGFTPPSPVGTRAIPSARQNHGGTGSPSTSRHSFSLSPLNRPVAGVGASSQQRGFAPVGRAGQQTNSPVERLNRMTGKTTGGGFAPDQVYGATPSGRGASSRPSSGRKKSPANALNNPSPGSGASTSRPVVTVPFSAVSLPAHRLKSDYLSSIDVPLEVNLAVSRNLAKI